jgi:hypothetical protein
MLTSRWPRARASQSIRSSRTERLKTGSPIAMMPISLLLLLSQTRYLRRRPKPLDTGTDHVSAARRNRSLSHVSADIRCRTGVILATFISFPDAKCLTRVEKCSEIKFWFAANRSPL